MENENKKEEVVNEVVNTPVEKTNDTTTQNENVNPGVDILQDAIKTNQTNVHGDTHQKEKVVEPKKETTGSQKGRISIMGDLQKGTKEDRNIDRVVSIAKDATENPTESPEIISAKEANKAKAGIIVELVDTVFMFLCMLITWDFTEENQKSYTLNDSRKKAIKYNLELIYNSSSKKSDPKKTIIWLIVGSYAPLLFIAVCSLIARLRKRKEEKEKEIPYTYNPATNTASPAEQKFDEQKKQTEKNYTEVKNNPTGEFIEPQMKHRQFIPPIGKQPLEKPKGKQGRHKLTCARTKNKNANCNCK